MTEKPTSHLSRKPSKTNATSYSSLATRKGLKTFKNTNTNYNLTTESRKFY